ncbi:hypothetical protein JCM10207_004697 [Rhodosporidiobolus poonsookiae]
MVAFSSLAVSAALLLPFVSAAAFNQPSPHFQRRGRSFPRRLDRRVADGVQCSSDGKTYSLCAGGTCTEMGAVAAGTICKDGAMTWDTGSDASEGDSSDAGSSSYAAATTTAAAVNDTSGPSKTTSAAASVETGEADEEDEDEECDAEEN